MTTSNNNASPEARVSKDLTGVWGGTGLSLEMKEGGGELDYDCAHGTIEGTPIQVTERKFTAKGLHFRERPGPTREGQDQGQAAEYAFTVEGDSMTLTVTLPGSEETLGPYVLKKGSYGRIRKCL